MNDLRIPNLSPWELAQRLMKGGAPKRPAPEPNPQPLHSRV